MTELFQFAAVLGVFLAVAVAWLFVIYLPGRTMEDWRDKHPRKRRKKAPKLP